MPTLAKTLTATAVTALALTAVPAPATAAEAAASISCRVSGQAQYLPGAMRLQLPDLVLKQDQLRNCADRGNLGFSATRLRADFSDVDLSCGVTRSIVNAPGVITLVWNTRGGDRTSSADVVIKQVTGNTAKVTGTVKTGEFAGRRFTGTFDTTLFGSTGTCISSAGLNNSITTTFSGEFAIA